MSSKTSTGAVQQSTVRDKIDKLGALLSETLDIEIQIVGSRPPSVADAEAAVDAKKPADLTLDVIEFTLDALLVHARDVVSQLKQIQQRLG